MEVEERARHPYTASTDDGIEEVRVLILNNRRDNDVGNSINISTKYA